MAYSFPPRGFSKPVQDHQFPPQFSTPQFPPPRQPPHACPPPPVDYSAWYDGPQFHGGAPQFGPGPSVRCPRPPHAGPSHRGAWAGVRGAGPRAPPGMPGQFPQRFVGNGSRQQRPMGPRHPHHPAHNNMSSTSDITECESWPGLPGRKGPDVQPNPPAPGGPRQQGNKNQGPQWNNTKRGKRGRKNKQGASSSQDGNTTGPSQQEDYCDMCDHVFKTRALLDDHIKQHVKCNHPDCKYEAHVKIVKLHQKIQHAAGSKKVTWLDTPTEIAKWRAERKRNYPTEENITRKQEAMKTKQAKGAVLQNKYFGKMRQPKRKHEGQSDDQEAVPAKKVNLGSLSALAVYNDSEEEEEEGEILEDTPNPKAVTSPKKSLTASFRENKRGRKQGPQGGKGKKTRRFKRGGKSLQEKREKERQARLRKRPNLLEMLLAPEIRRERNTILQCVRYVVQNNFFDVSGTEKAVGQASGLQSGRGSGPGTDGESGIREAAADEEMETGCREEMESGDEDRGSGGKDGICSEETGSQETGRDSERASTLGESAIREDAASSGNCKVLEVAVEDVSSQSLKEAVVENTSDQESSRPDESCVTEEPETESAQATNGQMPSTCADSSPANGDSSDFDKDEIKLQEKNNCSTTVDAINTAPPHPQPDMNGRETQDPNKPTS